MWQLCLERKKEPLLAQEVGSANKMMHTILEKCEGIGEVSGIREWKKKWGENEEHGCLR